MVIERVKKPSSMLKAAAENVAGVYLPKFVLSRDDSKDSTFENFGVGAGGQVVQTTRQQHIETLTLIIKMASLQTSFLTLDNAIKTTSRRVNALEYVVMPQIEGIISYIKSEMDEMEREEFFRVKKVVQKKKQKLALEFELMQKEAAAAKQAPIMLDNKDPDLIF